MEFGKVEHLQTIDFRLPIDHHLTAQNWQQATPQAITCYIGCPIWACKAWVGSWYPPHAKEKDFLYYYAQQFNTIELNTTHYRIPDKATVQQWKEKVTPHFKFCPKMLQEVSHQQQLKGQTAHYLTQLFVENLAELGQQLGIIFIQLPPFFGADKLGVLEQYLKTLPQGIEFAIEFRHTSWFEQDQYGASPIDQAGALLRAYGIATIQSDVAGRRDVLHQCLPTNLLALRFVGNDLHATDYSRTTAWVQKINDWVAKGLQTIYLFIHEPDNIKAPEMVVYWINELNKQPHYHLAMPKRYMSATPPSLF